MTTFSKNSRYAKYADVYKTTDRRGEEVLAVLPAKIPLKRNRGAHTSKEGQRLDHIAWHYLKDAEAFWVLTTHNARLLPDAVQFQYRIRIPVNED
jgi:hypothetical protein